MLWNDLREYLNKLDECAELKRINGAHWSEEIGAIAELMTERRGPALLFDELKDYPSGYRVAANVFSTPRRTAIAFGCLPNQPTRWPQRWTQMMERFHPITPKEVSRPPVFENVSGKAESIRIRSGISKPDNCFANYALIHCARRCCRKSSRRGATAAREKGSGRAQRRIGANIKPFLD